MYVFMANINKVNIYIVINVLYTYLTILFVGVRQLYILRGRIVIETSIYYIGNVHVAIIYLCANNKVCMIEN